jgi:hypothetical protein
MAPNPAISSTTIVLKAPVKSASVTLFDALGRMVGTFQFANERTLQIPVANLKSGTYFVKINTEKYTATKKLIVN